MDREGFRNRMKQYKKAWEENPGLKYWEWKQKYDSATKPDNMPSQPKPDTPMAGLQQAENRAHRWDNEHYVDQVNTVFDADRYRSWKEPAQKTFGNRVKFTYRDFMKPADVKHMNFLKSIGRLGSALKGASIFDEVVQNLFPSEEAELIEDMRVKMDKQNKWLTGQEDIPKYDEGGQVEPDPLEVLERSRPKLHGIPLAKGNIDGVFSPIDIPLATLPKVWSVINKWLPNYGPTLGALIVGDNGQPVNKSAKPIVTKRIEPDVEEFYRDIVIPLRPQEDYVKNIYLTRPGTFKYNVYPDDVIPSNRVAEYSPTTGEIRVKESMLNSPQLDQTLAHDGSHDLEKLQRTKEAQDIIDEALVAQKNPISKESNLIQEKGAEVTRMGYNAFKYMKDHGLMQVKNPLAKTKAYQDYVLNATQEQLAEMMGDFTAYSRDYKAGKIDYDKIRWALAYAPEIAAGLIVPQHLLSNDTESKQWI